LKIILDTNIWISFLINRDFKKLDVQLTKRNIRFLFSEELMEEFLEVARRPKLKKFFSKQNLNQLVENFENYGEFIRIKSKMNLCRDPKDNFLLNLAIDGKADFLVTGDKDLLVLDKIGDTRIITMREFLDLNHVSNKKD